jgi:GT2 family glycosyltransferase
MDTMADISIIIVTYNGLRECTIPCLESIFRNGGDADFEVVVVDNNSSDETPHYLSEWACREPRLRLVLNSTNRGFAGGNNDGIAVASGKLLVLLNNDTLVGKGWLSSFCRALRGDHSIGLAGPVSNAVGNEQKIFTLGRTPDEILVEGEAWAGNSAGDTFDAERLGFFCVALRRSLVDAVGLLDENYGLGFYEDDDYCLRVRDAGYRLVCLEDVFIYHRGSASFGKDPELTRRLLKKNRRMLENKLGSSYRPEHPRKRQLALVERYLAKARGDEQARMLFKAQNRVRLLELLAPRSFFKKAWFGQKLKGIKRRMHQAGERLLPQ